MKGRSSNGCHCTSRFSPRVPALFVQANVLAAM